MGARRRCFATLGVLLVLGAGRIAVAQDRVEISRGPDRVVFGSCVPSLKAINSTRVPIEYLEVGLSFTLKSGESRTLAFRSRYRGGIERPIAPGMTGDLTVQPDLSQPLGVDCADIVSVAVIDAICEAAGKPCSGIISVDTGQR